MLTRALRKFLSQPRVARLATLGHDGYPHIVPIYFMVSGDDIIFASDNNERKVVNAREHPHGAVAIGGEPEKDNAGYMIQGDLSIEQAADEKLVRQLAKRYASDEESSEWMAGDPVIIRLKPRKVIRVW